MIDWVTLKLSCEHDGNICDGVVAKVNREGDTEWLSMSRLPVEGSYGSTIAIRSVTESTLEISGNPAKWLQGHNLFGTDDLVKLVWEFFKKLKEIPELNLRPTFQQLTNIKNGQYTVSRVDVNATWLLDNPKDVLAWINAAGQKMRLKHRGAGQFKGDTLYWGKGSRRWSLKCYHKGSEIEGKRSKFPDALRTPQMLDYASRSLRFEATFRSNFLREGMLHVAKHWSPETAKMLLISCIEGLEMSNNMRLSDAVLASLKPRLATSYLAWYGGADLKQILPKNTFYRYRRELKKYDIDIAILRDKEQEDSKVIPLMRVLEAEPVGIPDWAYEQGLVAC